jgi:truncated hemoglobin YjbI
MMRHLRVKTTRKLTDKHDKAVAPLIERAIDNGEFTEEEQKILKEHLKNLADMCWKSLMDNMDSMLH